MSEFRCPKCDGPTYRVSITQRACRNCTNIFAPADEVKADEHLEAVKAKKTTRKKKAPK